MNPIAIKSTTLDEIVGKVKEGQALYDRLTDAERAEVDAFNDKIHGKSIVEILAAGTHPIVALRQKYLGR